VDDAMAILFALRSPELEVLGLTTVFGNTGVEVTTQNALRLVELEGHAHIPVARGAGCPLVIAPRSLGPTVHGEDGMGGTHPPPPQGKPLDIPAAQFIVEQVRAYPGELTLVPLGPLSNLALALRLDPEIVNLVAGVVIMGGAATVAGNASPVAEANIHNDPHAAAIVFSAGWPLVMVGLDVTMQVVMDQAFLEALGSAGNPATDLIRDILPMYQSFHDQIYGLDGAIHTHDPSAIAYVIDPTLFQAEETPLFVETEGHCSGQTVPDRRSQWGKFQKARVCLHVETDRLLDLYRARITQ
jgi:uridine nucleosidase